MEMEKVYRPECFYQGTKVTNLKEIKKGDMVVGLVSQWDLKKRSLIVKIGTFTGILPEKELTIEELKFPNGDCNMIPAQAKIVLYKKICAKVTHIKDNIIYLSRKALQLEAYPYFQLNETYKVVIKNVVPFGLYVDMGVGITGFIPASEVTTTRRDITADFYPDQVVDAVLTVISHKFTLSLRQALKSPPIFAGDTVIGTVYNQLNKKTGYYVEISPNDNGILDSVGKDGKHIDVEYGTKVLCRVKNVKTVSDQFGGVRTLCKLSLIR